MTKIVFYRRRGVYYGFRETGHAGFGDAGQDVVCAALSAMTMLVVNTLEVVHGLDVSYSVEEKTTNVTVICESALPGPADEKKQYAAASLIYGYYLQLVSLSEDYYDYLEVEVEDR